MPSVLRVVAVFAVILPLMLLGWKLWPKEKGPVVPPRPVVTPLPKTVAPIPPAPAAVSAISSAKKAKSDIQQDQADLVIEFTSWSRLSITKPLVADEIDDRGLQQLIGGREMKRELAVVILSKFTDEGKSLLDQIEAELKSLGFKKTIFQKAVGITGPDGGLPIIRE